MFVQCLFHGVIHKCSLNQHYFSPFYLPTLLLNRTEPLLERRGSLLGRTKPPASGPSDGGSAAPDQLQINWSSSVVTLLRQGATHHLTPIKRDMS